MARLRGTSKTPIIIDVREEEAVAADPRVIPTSQVLDYTEVESWAVSYRGQSVAVSCQRGKKLAEGTAAWLRHVGANAEVVEGGFEAWRAMRGCLSCRSTRFRRADRQALQSG